MADDKKVEKDRFVELDYTGKTEEGFIFDTTDEKLAKENGLYSEKKKYEPIVICVGKNHVLEGLDEALIGKEVGKEYSIELTPEKAFGKRTPSLIKLVSLAQFKKHNLNPTPGMQVEIDGKTGFIKSISGGRVLVDFNHPLAGKNIKYDVKVNRIVDDDKEKIDAILKIRLGLPEIKSKIEDGKAIIGLDFELPQQIKTPLEEEIKESTGKVKEVIFKEKKKEKQDNTKKSIEQ
jgi:FKBP-type peptidyl-prolyl cis-trans isomerase SlyD